ncbi:MAG TPA: response regulator [Gemmatimonadaceae bacterium]|nr:response regulator [Gemmatimonadaceae bacterium]
MSASLRILHLEDDAADAALVEAILADEGLACTIVRAGTREQFIDALEGDYDLIVADFAIPGFDGISAQRLALERRPEVPFVFVSGTMGEEVAIERLKAGATDYVLKQRIQRLPSAVRRALDETRDRRERRRAENEIIQLNAELEQRVVDRTAQLAFTNLKLHAREGELQEAKEFLEQLMASSPSMIFRFDPYTLRATYVSPNVGWLLGYTIEEVLGVPGFWEAIIHPEDRSLVMGRLSAAFDETVVQIEQEYRCRIKVGRYRWFFNLLRIEYDADARPTGILGYALDIEDRKAAEEEARLAKLESERANRAKSDFLSRMSHDLRTPLNAVLGFAQLLEMDGLSPNQLDSVTQILNGGRHLLELINEVLDIARIESGELSLSPEAVPVAAVIQQMVDLVAPLGLPRHIAVRADAENNWATHVRADQQRLRQVLLNLVGNAVKYNREGGDVRVSCATRPGARVVISVTNTGAGIPPHKLPLLFKPFERLGAEQGPVEGTGLGLAVSKALTEAMEGTIGVHSDAVEGTTFWIELPEQAPDSAPARPAHERRVKPPASRVGEGTILYIEDNPSNIRLMERLLERRGGIRLVTASSGDQGLSLAREAAPDLVFLDLHLPDIPGEEVLHRLMSDEATRHLSVAILSADATLVQRERLLALGAIAYVTKPIHFTDVLRLVDERIAGRRSGDNR